MCRVAPSLLCTFRIWASTACTYRKVERVKRTTRRVHAYAVTHSRQEKFIFAHRDQRRDKSAPGSAQRRTPPTVSIRLHASRPRPPKAYARQQQSAGSGSASNEAAHLLPFEGVDHHAAAMPHSPTDLWRCGSVSSAHPLAWAPSAEHRTAAGQPLCPRALCSEYDAVASKQRHSRPQGVSATGGYCG
jgi:hypothetical protein